MVSIYTLEHPITGEIRYVGKTVMTLPQRLVGHMNLEKRKKCHKSSWIKSLKLKGLKPKIKLLDIVPDEEWGFWENFWIELMLTWGVRLCNHQKGGNQGHLTPKRLPSNTKKVYQYDLNGNFIKEWISLNSTQKDFGYNGRTNISKSIVLGNTAYGYYWSYEKLDIFAPFKILKKYNAKKIEQYSLGGVLLASFNSAQEAENITNINRKNISNVLRNKSKTAGNYKWKYSI